MKVDRNTSANTPTRMMNADRHVACVDSFVFFKHVRTRTHTHKRAQAHNHQHSTQYFSSVTSGLDWARPCERGGVLADRRCW